jgi:hypothetical protein
VALVVLIVLGAALAPPIPQDPAYHDFADRRAATGVPNVLNVASNWPFLLVVISTSANCAVRATSAPTPWSSSAAWC